MSEVWIFSAVSGWKQAAVVEPAKALEMMTASTKSAILLGALATDYQAKVFNGANLVTIGPVAKRLDLKKVSIQDPYETIKDGYDTLAFLGFDFWFLNQLFQHLKHFSKTKTISLERFYHPNANYSLKTMSEEEWLKAFGGKR
ncbi:MAG: hypothetical protein JXB14_06775 [Candidatus Altiarchaeota archaeon]|nr:hypothetical protein [Candidatus Altiarchaeota archaeon]